MVKYYGRARQRIGSVNTNQLGLKMSGCPSRVGRNPVNARYIKQRVNCMQGTCGPIQIHGVNVPSNKFRNNPPYCKKRSTTCLAAAGGIGNINTPYYRTPAPGEKGCGCNNGPCASNADGVKQPYQGSGGNIPTNNLGLQFIPGDGTVEIPITTLSTNNQLWISNFDTATPSSRQSQVFDIYNTLADNRIYLDYIANQADDVAGGGLLIFPIGQTSMNDTTLQSNFTNVWLLTSEVNLSRMVSLVFFGSKQRKDISSERYDQNGFSNGEADANLGVPSSVPTSGSGVGLLIEHTVYRAGVGSYVLRPGSTITLPTL